MASCRDHVDVPGELYRIVVRGPGVERLADLIETTAVRVEGETTVFTTEIVDGSHLRGVLDLIADLGVQLVVLERIRADDG